MIDLKEWKFPFPQGTELQERLEKKRLEYWKRLNHPDKSDGERDLLTRFHKRDNSDFRLLYLKFVVLSTVMLITERTEPDKRQEFAITSRYICADLSAIFRIYQYPDELNSACKVIWRYITGSKPIVLEEDERKLEPAPPVQ